MRIHSSGSLRVAMLARVVFPLHGFGGIERHVFHLVTHLARLGVRVTLYVQTPTADHRAPATQRQATTGDFGSGVSGLGSAESSSIVHRPSSLPGVESVIFLRYDHT